MYRCDVCKRSVFGVIIVKGVAHCVGCNRDRMFALKSEERERMEAEREWEERWEREHPRKPEPVPVAGTGAGTAFTLAEINRLEFTRYLVRTGRMGS